MIDTVQAEKVSETLQSNRRNEHDRLAEISNAVLFDETWILIALPIG